MSTRPCTYGCTRRGQHVTDCAGGECMGCMPREAMFGELCQWCWQRLNADIVDSPALARYLWQVAQPNVGSQARDDTSRPGAPSARSVLHDATDALDGLHSCLASWAHLILEEHPDGYRMHGPDERGTVRTQTVAVLDGPIVTQYGQYLRRSTVAGVRDPKATSRLVKWLLPHLTWCSQQEWAAEMRREVGQVVRTTMARYPVAERTRHVPGVECPDCQQVSLVYDPPTLERRTVQVNCSSRGCGRIYTEDEFARLVKRIEWEHAHPEGSEAS